MQVVEGSIERIVALGEGMASFAVAVDAVAEGAFEAGDGVAVDEVVEMLLRGAMGL